MQPGGEQVGAESRVAVCGRDPVGQRVPVLLQRPGGRGLRRLDQRPQPRLLRQQPGHLVADQAQRPARLLHGGLDVHPARSLHGAAGEREAVRHLGQPAGERPEPVRGGQRVPGEQREQRVAGQPGERVAPVRLGHVEVEQHPVEAGAQDVGVHPVLHLELVEVEAVERVPVPGEGRAERRDARLRQVVEGVVVPVVPQDRRGLGAQPEQVPDGRGGGLDVPAPGSVAVTASVTVRRSCAGR